MALQGDLQSFALPDVLRLLAGTAKTGRLAVSGGDRSGDVYLDGGRIVGGEVTSSPFANDPADVVFELLRFESGSFEFDDSADPLDGGSSTTVDEAIGRAEELLREWQEVEAVVPSVESWVTFAPEIDSESTTVAAGQWRVLATIGGGMTVREIGDRFAQTDLVASRQVKELVEAGLVVLGEPPTDRPGRTEPSGTEPTPAAEVDDLSLLRAEDGPVVIETSEDALLPEPLPGESTSFEGDLADAGTVDGRETAEEEAPAPEPVEAFTPFDAGYDTAQPEPEPEFEAVEPEPEFEAVEPEPVAEAEAPAAADPFATDDPFGDADDFFTSPVTGEPTEEVAGDPLASTPSTDAGAGAAGGGGDPDRGALLDFLSTVKR